MEASAGNGLRTEAEQVGQQFLLSAASQFKRDDRFGDPLVTTSFALGWQIAELYRPIVRSRSGTQDELPGFGELTPADQSGYGSAVVTAGLTKLSGPITAAGLTVPVVDDVTTALTAGTPRTARSLAISTFHVDLLTTLTAADFRLGKAYGLGRALADTCMQPSDHDSLQDELEHYRIETLRAWLEDLKTALPAHAGQTVSDSLAAWSTWADGAAAAGAQPGPGAGVDGRPDAAAQTAADLLRLREQGRLWRSLLSGEKAATDMLSMDDYVRAATTMLRRSGKLVREFLIHHLLLVGVVLALFAGGIALMLADKSGTASIVAGASGVLASFGLGYRAIGGSLGRAFGKLEQPLWEASLDQWITAAITLAPSAGANPNFRDQEPPPAARRPTRAARKSSAVAAATPAAAAPDDSPAATAPDDSPAATAPDDAAAPAAPDDSVAPAAPDDAEAPPPPDAPAAPDASATPDASAPTAAQTATDGPAPPASPPAPDPTDAPAPAAGAATPAAPKPRRRPPAGGGR